jgi:hypothetical protein
LSAESDIEGDMVVIDEVVEAASSKVGHRSTPAERCWVAGGDVGGNSRAREVPDLDTALVPESSIDTAAGVVEASAVAVGGVGGDTATCSEWSVRVVSMDRLV